MKTLFVRKNAPTEGLSRKTWGPDLLKLKAVGDAGPGTFEGYGAVYGNIDRDNEIIAKGAFADSLAAFVRDGFIAKAHKWEEGIATIDEAREDEYGLFIRCTFHGDEDSQETRVKTMERIQRGKSVGLSVGFMPEAWEWDDEKGIRTITRATLYEVSIVTVPCNPMAQVIAAKSGQPTAPNGAQPPTGATTPPAPADRSGDGVAEMGALELEHLLFESRRLGVAV